jgi:polyisoprenoid-binding protein YceI
MSKLRWILVVVAALAVLGIAGPYVYIHLIEGDAPERLTLEDASTTTTAAASSSARDGIAGAWTVGAGSEAGYRVKEVLFGQDTEAVGRTSDVTGSLTVDDTTVTKANFSVDLTTVASDQSRRDGQFQNRIMQTSQFPTATFTLTDPIDVSTLKTDGTTSTVSATGDLTVHGVTKRVTFDLHVKATGGTVAVNGTLPVVFADYGIGDPSFGPAKVQDHGEIEVLLVLT